MTGELFINGVDAYTTWGMSLAENSLSALLTPAPNKSLLTNKVRAAHGKEIVTGQTVFKDERSLTLNLIFTADDKETFFQHYADFCGNVLAGGLVNISTSYQSGTVYKCIYESCTQFMQFCQGIGQFTLKLTEYNPNDREADND